MAGQVGVRQAVGAAQQLPSGWPAHLGRSFPAAACSVQGACRSARWLAAPPPPKHTQPGKAPLPACPVQVPGWLADMLPSEDPVYAQPSPGAQQQQLAAMQQLPLWLRGLHSWRYGDGPEWIHAPGGAAGDAGCAGRGGGGCRGCWAWGLSTPSRHLMQGQGRRGCAERWLRV